jgi:hypothetical protein
MSANRHTSEFDMTGLIEYVAKSLVDDPTQVKVRRRDSNGVTVLELRVSSTDTGRIIGKSGRVANAMRTLLRVGESENRGKRVIFKIQ